jgi:nucleotide-binding universal stress UspA family protein
MKTIIAGTDFTASSVNACKYAAFLAQKLKCRLIIFNLFEAPLVRSNAGLYGISYTSQRNESLRNTNKLVGELKKQFPDVNIGSFVRSGSFRQELETFVAAHQIAAAIMGLEAKDWISRYIYGSRGLSLAGKISCPVIIVPSKYQTHKLSKIVLAVDNNAKLLKSPLKGVKKFVEKTKTSLDLLHVRTPNEVFEPITSVLKINGKKTPIEQLRARSIAAGIKKNIRLKSQDMVVLISKKHSALYNLFTESNTKRIAFAATVPVMSIHE